MIDLDLRDPFGREDALDVEEFVKQDFREAAERALVAFKKRWDELGDLDELL